MTVLQSAVDSDAGKAPGAAGFWWPPGAGYSAELCATGALQGQSRAGVSAGPICGDFAPSRRVRGQISGAANLSAAILREGGG
jgi:hypothetical protein